MNGTSDTLSMLSGMTRSPYLEEAESFDEYMKKYKEGAATEKEIDDAKAERKRKYFDFLKGMRQDASDEEREHAEKDLSTQATIAGNMSEIFTTMYKAKGSKSKELFYLAKAAAVAEAIINVSKGITACYGMGPWGVPLALTIGALGAVQIATIMSTGLAAGGPVEGSSPSKTADNILVRVTAGEYFHPVDSVQYYGKGVMEGIRTRSIPREIFAGLSLPGSTAAGNKVFQAGGLVGEAPVLAGPGERAEITMVNITDPREIDRFLATPSGQNAVLNVLSSRRTSAQRILR